MDDLRERVRDVIDLVLGGGRQRIDLSPDPPADVDRRLSAQDLAALWAMAAVAGGSLTVGVELTAGGPLALSLSQVLLVVPLGVILGALVLAAVALLGSSTGVPSALLVRPALGTLGSIPAVLAFIVFVVMVGALAISDGGAAMDLALGPVLDGIGWALLVGVIGLALVLLGPFGMARYARAFGFWASLVLLFVVLIEVLDKAGGMAERPYPGGLLLGLDVVVGFLAAWAAIVPDTSRFADEGDAPAAAYGFAVAALVGILAGAAMGAAGLTGQARGVAVAAGLVGAVGAALLVLWVLIAEADQGFFLMYPPTVWLRSLDDRIPPFGAVLAAAGPMVILAIGASRPTLVAWRDLAASVVIVVMTVVVVDHRLVRNGYYQTDDLYRWDGGRYGWLNPVGTGAALVGLATRHAIDPVGPVDWVAGWAPVAEALPDGIPATIVSVLVAGGLYAVLGRWLVHEPELVSHIRSF